MINAARTKSTRFDYNTSQLSQDLLLSSLDSSSIRQSLFTLPMYIQHLTQYMALSGYSINISVIEEKLLTASEKKKKTTLNNWSENTNCLMMQQEVLSVIILGLLISRSGIRQRNCHNGKKRKAITFYPPKLMCKTWNMSQVKTTMIISKAIPKRKCFAYLLNNPFSF